MAKTIIRPADGSLGSLIGWQKVGAGLIKKGGGHLITALCGAVLGVGSVIGFWLSPLKQIVMHKMWPEQAEVTILTPSVIKVGEPMQVLVQVMPLSEVPLSEGVLTVSSGNSAFFIKSGVSSRTTPQSAAPMLLLKDEPLVFQAAAPGTFTLTGNLKTRRRSYMTSASILVLPINQPTMDNLSGQWHVRMGQNLGTMELIHRGAEISGIYRFPSIQMRGSVNGFVDGKTFNADFVNQGETRRKWAVRALYMQTGGYVEIKDGGVTRQIMKNNDWMPSGNTEEFYATSASDH